MDTSRTSVPIKVRRHSPTGERVIRFFRRFESLSYKCILVSASSMVGIWPLAVMMGGAGSNTDWMYVLPFLAMLFFAACGVLFFLLRNFAICIFFVQFSLSQIYLALLAAIGCVMLIGLLEGIGLALAMVGLVCVILYVSAEIREQDPTAGGKPPGAVPRAERRQTDASIFSTV